MEEQNINETKNNNEMPGETKKRSTGLMIIILLVCFAAGFAVGYFVLFDKDSDNNETNKVNETNDTDTEVNIVNGSWTIKACNGNDDGISVNGGECNVTISIEGLTDSYEMTSIDDEYLILKITGHDDYYYVYSKNGNSILNTKNAVMDLKYDESTKTITYDDNILAEMGNYYGIAWIACDLNLLNTDDIHDTSEFGTRYNDDELAVITYEIKYLGNGKLSEKKEIKRETVGDVRKNNIDDCKELEN